MADFFDALDERHRAFIEAQQVFFVATAGPAGRINLSPKGLDSLRVLSAEAISWLNLTGSGNESAAHLLENPRMTLMFCSFERTPLILRVYGEASVVHRDEPGWNERYARFTPHAGARQVFDLRIDSVQTSCGFAVPRYDFVEERPTLTAWADRKGDEGVRRYWQDRNAVSIDGKPTGMPPPTARRA